MRYIANSSGYLLEVSFGARLSCGGKNCTAYTGSVPSGYDSLEDWYAQEAENLHRWKIVEDNLTLDSEAADPVPDTIPWNNLNLLDNWYFVNPINQRGQTIYDEAAQYTIDRWAKTASTGSFVALENGGLEVNNAEGTSVMYLRQKFEQTLPAGIYTLSFNVLTYNYTDAAPYVYISNGSGYAIGGRSVKDCGFFSVTVTATEDNPIARIQLQIPIGSMVVLESIKLEKGAVSTLANDPPPNRVQELAKCQRYQISIFPASGTYIAGMGMASGETRANVFLALPVTLRATPVITFSNLYLRNVATDISSQVTDVTEYGKTANGDWLLLTASGLTAGDTYFLRSENGSLLLDANL